MIRKWMLLYVSLWSEYYLKKYNKHGTTLCVLYTLRVEDTKPKTTRAMNVATTVLGR